MPEHPLGLDDGTVRVVPYHARWPALFETERTRLEQFLAALSPPAVIAHTGSTAIVGMPAKPVLDLLIGLSTDAQRADVIRALEAASYSYRGEQGIPGRDFFRRGNPRQYHVHVTLKDSAFWQDHRAFRQYLEAHPDVAEAYAKLKLELAERFPFDRGSYIDGKTDFVNDVLTRARSLVARKPND